MTGKWWRFSRGCCWVCRFLDTGLRRDDGKVVAVLQRLLLGVEVSGYRPSPG